MKRQKKDEAAGTRNGKGRGIPLRLLKPYKVQLTIGPACKLFEAILELLIPTLMVYVVDRGVKTGDIVYILKMGGVMLAIAAVGFASALICQYSASIASQGYGTELRNALFCHIGTFSHKELDRFGTASLVNRLTNDINVLQQAVAMLIRLVVRAPFICIGSLIMAMSLNLKLSAVIFTALPMLVLAIYLVMSKTIPLYRKVQAKLDTIATVTRENLSGVRVIRAFGKRAGEEARFGEANEAYRRHAVHVGKISALLSPATSVIMNFAIIAVLWFGGVQVDAGSMTSGEIIAFINYISYMVTALLVTANLVILFTRAYASYGRITEIFETEGSIGGPADAAEDRLPAGLSAGSGAGPGGAGSAEMPPAVRFEHVTFAYSEGAEPVLKDVSFTLAQGGTLGIIGGTGSGKSTLISLIPRFYDVSEGTVYVNGQDVRSVPVQALRGRISVVAQKAVLFSGTVEENIRQGKKDASEQEVRHAAETAQAAEFIQRLPDGYDTIVERGGMNFSGGQKQRLSIARALVRKPEILILDDSTSALDYATEAALRSALRKASQGPGEAGKQTVIIVAQRAGSVRHADQILVLDDGRVAAMGTHDELYETCDIYKEICQLSGE